MAKKWVKSGRNNGFRVVKEWVKKKNGWKARYGNDPSLFYFLTLIILLKLEAARLTKFDNRDNGQL